jgi:polysaccharide export outer membrane protein
MSKKLNYFIPVILLPLLFSCVNTKKVAYFNALSDAELNYKIESLEPVIQKNDLLSITVTSMNGEASVPFNLYSVSQSIGGVNAGTVVQAAGFLVDQEGNLQFPVIGTIKAFGLTKKQLKELITNELVQRKMLYDPVVNVRYLNYKVTVLGEVRNPSVFNVPGERITLLEALGLAGDLTIYARRTDVLIIREEQEGKRISKRINLNDNDLLTSPYYYLKSNDIVYVTPDKANVVNASATRVWLPTILGALTFVTVVIGQLTN